MTTATTSCKKCIFPPTEPTEPTGNTRRTVEEWSRNGQSQGYLRDEADRDNDAGPET